MDEDVMGYTLGLDVSTSCVGWSLLSNVDPTRKMQTIELGAITLSDLEDHFEKADRVWSEIVAAIKGKRIIKAYVEEDLQRFQPGMSSAKTIQQLSRFNGMTCLILYQILEMKPVYVNVNAARKAVGCKVDRADKKHSTKEKVFSWVSSQIVYDWPERTLKSGPRKGVTEIERFCFDMADAYVVNRAGQVLYP